MELEWGGRGEGGGKTGPRNGDREAFRGTTGCPGPGGTGRLGASGAATKTLSRL